MAPADPSLTSLPPASSAASKCVVNNRRPNYGSSDHVRIASAVSLTSIREAIQEEEQLSGGPSSSSTAVSLEQRDDQLLLHVSRSYNRLSLKHKGKKRKQDLVKSDVNLIEEISTTAKKPRLEEDAANDKSYLSNEKTMNGHNNKLLESRFANSPGMGSLSGSKTGNPPIASLSNLGNTCFLNSVLYTLRFTPGFLHSLHHLVYDLGLQGNSSKKKCGSNFNGNVCNGGIADADTELVHDVVDQLHDLFKSMSCTDETPEGSREPIPPNTFLQAVGKLNPMFEGNQQQDAHELLVTVLNTLQDIKIPVPCPAGNQVADNVDGIKEEPNKKTGKKKGGKSIFYSSNNISTAMNGSNGVKSTSKVDQISYATKSLNLHGTELAYLPNFVRENFVGKSVMGTRCLECEASTYRSETFTNIHIPLTFEDQDEPPDSLSVKDLFLKQIMASETLRENNKYWCSECSRLNEAQRSVQYEILPRVMVLQLKRFTATGNKSYTSKINEYIPTPFTMNCFCTQCMPNGNSPTAVNGGSSKHHYKLYAVIMHLGATLASGHYTAYVRAGEQALEYIQCNRTNSVERKNKGGKGIMKYFSRSSDQRASVNGQNGIGNGGSCPIPSDPNGCRSANCCGVRTYNQLGLPDSTVSANSSVSMGSVGTSVSNGSGQQINGLSHHHQKSMDSVDSGGNFDFDQEGADEAWLECDDETIHVISRKQFEEDLSCNRGFTTPYLLFYQRV